MERSGLANLALSANGFLFDTTTGHTYTLNKTGTLILKSLIEGVSPASIAEKLTDLFEVYPEVATQDVEQFLARLFGLGLMRE